MDRRKFLAYLNGTAAGAALAPVLKLAPTPYLKPPSMAWIAEAWTTSEIERIRARYVIPAAEQLYAQANRQCAEMATCR